MSENKEEHYETKAPKLSSLSSKLDGFLNLLYPTKCLVCAKVLPHSKYLPACDGCFLGFNLVNEIVTGDFSFDRNLSFFEYNDTLKEIIHNIKFGKRAHKMANLAKLAVKVAENKGSVFSDYEGFDAVIPVPLHKKRFRERGFNQAYVLAKELSKAINVPIDDNICERAIYTLPQSMMSAGNRQENVAGIFSLKKDSHVSGKKFVLVDDIFTTGETLNSLASLLKESGAKSIVCITVGIAHAKPLKTDTH